MEAYLVRLGGTGDGKHELVGIFCVRSVQQLAEYVDDFCEADGVEYAALGPGGVGWGGRAYGLPLKDDPQYRKDIGEAEPNHTICAKEQSYPSPG